METDASKIIKKVEEKFDREFQDLHKRMDEDYPLWDMTNELVTDYETSVRFKTKVHGSELEFISNDLRTFSDNVQSTLTSADMQIAVKMAEAEGEDKREEIGKLERLLHFALEKGDERLIRLLQPRLRDSLIWYSLVRGWVAGRFLIETRNKGKDVIFNFMALDPRWLVYEVGKDGILWVAYKTFKSKAALESQYKKEIPDKPWYNFWQKPQDSVELFDYYEYEEEGKIGNAVLCKDTFLKQPDVLKIPSMPVLIMPVSTRPPIAGKDGIKLKGYGESIFAPDRRVNTLRNRFVTMVANHAAKLADQPLINYKTDLGIELHDLDNYPGGVANLPMGENRLEPSPMKEISPTVVQMLNFLNEQMEQGMLPKIPVGSPPPSGTMYNLAQEAGNKIYNPQLRNLNSFYADMGRLVEEQLIAGGIKVKIQGERKNKYYETQVTPIDLKKPHIIKVEFTARTPWTQMDTAQVAQMLQALGLPLTWIWENILKVQDPKLIQDLLALEVYEHSPEGMMKRAVEVLMDRGYTFEARKLVEKMDMMEAQERMMATAPPEGTPPEAGAGI